MSRTTPRRLVVALLALNALTLSAAASLASTVNAATVSRDSYAALHGINPLAASAAPSATPLTVTTPQAPCAAGARPEATQGRAPSADFTSGRAQQGYTCNIEQVGHYGLTGGFRVARYVDHAGHECAFYDSSLVFPKDIYRAQTGTYVMDMSDPANPVRTAVLATAAMQTPHESLRLNEARGLLVATTGSPAFQVGILDVYDVSQDCRHPELQSTLPMSLLGHESGFSPDGLTFWASVTQTGGLTAIDLTNPALPYIVWTSPTWIVHGLSLSADGTRAYLAALTADTELRGGSGLTILDVAQVQHRVPNPVVTQISTLTWPEASIPQNVLPVTIHGHSNAIEFDEYDSSVFHYSPTNTVGGIHIIDLADEVHPRLVSRIRLAVWNETARAGDQMNDPGAQRVGQGYAAHYCSVPRLVDPSLLACSAIASGLRLFDITNPLKPREVGYFNKPPVGGIDPSELGSYAMSSPAFVPARREIWFTDTNTGFYSVRVDAKAWTLR